MLKAAVVRKTQKLGVLSNGRRAVRPVSREDSNVTNVNQRIAANLPFAFVFYYLVLVAFLVVSIGGLFWYRKKKC